MRFVALATAFVLASPAALAEEPPAETSPSGDVVPAPPPPESEAPAADAATPAAAPAAPAPAAAVAASPTAPETPAAPPPAPARRPSQWGLLLEAGFPQGATLSASFRPVPAVRLFAGPAWNYLGFGLQGGVSLVPWHFAVTPILTLEAGHYFSEDVSFIAQSSQGVPPDLRSLMKSMGFTYGSVHAGLELGSQNGFAWTIGLGLTYVALDAKGTMTKTDASGTTVTFKDPRVRGTLPSLKLGFHYWF